MAFANNTAKFSNWDGATEQAQLQRQQLLAQALAQQAQEPLELPQTPAGGFVAPIGKGAVLGKLAQILGAGWAQKKTADAEQSFNQEKQARIADALTNYDELRSGKAAQPVEIFGTTPDQPMQGLMPAVTPNKKGASLSLLNSGVPELQQFGVQSLLAQKSPESLFNKVDPKDFTQESIARFSQSQNYADLVPARKKDFINTGGGHVAVDGYATNPGTIIENTGNRYKDLLVPGPDGAPVQNDALVSAKKAIQKAGAPNVNTTVSVAGPENQYNKDIGAGLAKDSLALIDIAKSAPSTIANANLIRNALDSGAITGTGAETRLTMQKALETAGVLGKGKASSTEQLMAGLGNLTLASVKTSGLGAGNGFTDKDREFLQSAISGQITGTKENLRRVADLSERVARANYAKGQAVLNRWSQDGPLKSISEDVKLDPLAEPQPSKKEKVFRWDPITGEIK